MTSGPPRGSYRESRDWIQAMRRSLCPQPLPFAEVLWSHTCKIMGPEHVTRSAPKTREPSACPWKDTGRGRALVLGGGWGVPGVWAGAPVGTGAQNQTPWVLGRLSHRRPGRPGPTPAPLCAGLPTRVLYGSPLRLLAATEHGSAGRAEPERATEEPESLPLRPGGRVAGAGPGLSAGKSERAALTYPAGSQRAVTRSKLPAPPPQPPRRAPAHFAPEADQSRLAVS